MKIKLYHPSTRDELLPLLTLRNGVVVYPILGADGSSGGGDGGDGGATDDDEDEEDEEEEDKGKGADSGDTGDKGDKDEPDTVDRAEYLKLKKRMKAADQRASKLEVELRKIADAGKPELEKLQADLAEEKRIREEAQASLNTSRLENAVLKDPQFSWNDPEDVVEMALKALRKGDLEINEEGEVEDVGAWLKALAKRKPHFLKPATTKRKKGAEEGDDDDSGTTGGAVGSGRKKGTKKLDDDAIRRRLPALR
jgi:hypothetical protein